jgi:ABC-2 type transport system permease protein
MVVFFALTAPIIALLTPRLLASITSSQPGVVIKMPDPTALDAYTQFVKNLSELVLIALIISGAGMISAERSSGTAILVLTKPLSRAAFVLSKLVAQIGLVVIVTTIGTAIALGMTRLLFPPLPAGPLWTAVGLWLVNAVLMVCAMTFCSAMFRSRGAAAGMGLGFLFLSLILMMWPAAQRYSFVGLGGLPGRALSGAPMEWGWPVGTALALGVVFVVGAVAGFRRKEL